MAFEHFGGVPGRIRYDNLKPAVVRVLQGRDRVESERFIALRSHYGFDSFFCRPGVEGAHEKGGVEGEIGRFRRRHLVPVPTVASLAELNELIAAGDAARRRPGDHRPAGHRRARRSPPRPPSCWRCRPSRSTRPGCCRPGSTTEPGSRCGSLLLGAGPLRRAPPARAADRPHRRGPRRRHSWSPATNGRSAATSRSSPWTTTSRSSRPSPAGCPARPRWPRPRPRARSPPRTRRYWDAVRRARGDAAGTRALIEILLAHRTLAAAGADRRDGPGRRQRAAWTRRWCSSTPAATRSPRSPRSSRSVPWPATTGPPRR